MSVLDGPGEGTWSVFAVKVVAERDEARAETARLRRLLNMAEDELIAADDHGRREAKRADTVEAEVEALKAERDEALAKLYEMNLKLNQAYTDAERLRKERDDAIRRITEVGVMVARGLGDLEKYAYKRGAEAMREACAAKVVEWLDHRWATALWLDKLIRELPIPEEP